MKYEVEREYRFRILAHINTDNSTDDVDIMLCSWLRMK